MQRNSLRQFLLLLSRVHSIKEVKILFVFSRRCVYVCVCALCFSCHLLPPIAHFTRKLDSGTKLGTITCGMGHPQQCVTVVI